MMRRYIRLLAFFLFFGGIFYLTRYRAAGQRDDVAFGVLMGGGLSYGLAVVVESYQDRRGGIS